MTKASRLGSVVAATFCFLFLSTSLHAATDTTIKGTTADSTAASLEATNSSNTSLLFVRNDGNVGIGTTAPSSLLSLLGTPTISVATTDAADNQRLMLAGAGTVTNSRSAYLTLNGNEFATSSTYGDSILMLGDGDAGANRGDFFLSSGQGTGLLTVLNAGNVGIGVTNPAGILDVSSTTETNIRRDTASTSTPIGNLRLRLTTSGTAANGLANGLNFNLEDAAGTDVGNIAAIYGKWEDAAAGQQKGALAFYTSSLAGGSTEKLTLDSGGNLNILTQGDLRLQDDTGGEYVAQQAATGTTSYTLTWPAAVSASNGFVLTSTTGGVLSWAAAGGGSGDVTDVGDCATGGCFIANGAGAGNSIYFEGPTANTFEVQLTAAEPAADIAVTLPNVTSTLYGTGAGTITSAQLLSSVSNETGTGVAVFNINPTFAAIDMNATVITNIGNAATDFTSAGYLSVASDIRFKKDVVPSPGLDAITKIDGVRWNWIKDGTTGAGVIAQQLEKVLPDTVMTNEEGFKSVKYDELFAPVIESIKELNDMNTVLKTENQTLKSELETLKARLDRLENTAKDDSQK